METQDVIWNNIIKSLKSVTNEKLPPETYTSRSDARDVEDIFGDRFESYGEDAAYSASTSGSAVYAKDEEKIFGDGFGSDDEGSLPPTEDASSRSTERTTFPISLSAYLIKSAVEGGGSGGRGEADKKITRQQARANKIADRSREAVPHVILSKV